MNIKQIIKEEIGDFDWIDTNQLSQSDIDEISDKLPREVNYMLISKDNELALDPFNNHVRKLSEITISFGRGFYTSSREYMVNTFQKYDPNQKIKTHQGYKYGDFRLIEVYTTISL